MHWLRLCIRIDPPIPKVSRSNQLPNSGVGARLSAQHFARRPTRLPCGDRLALLRSDVRTNCRFRPHESHLLSCLVAYLRGGSSDIAAPVPAFHPRVWLGKSARFALQEVLSIGGKATPLKRRGNRFAAWGCRPPTGAEGLQGTSFEHLMTLLQPDRTNRVRRPTAFWQSCGRVCRLRLRHAMAW